LIEHDHLNNNPLWITYVISIINQLLQIELGCRCIITQYLTSAAVYAQKYIDEDPQLKSCLGKMYKIMELDPHIAVFNDLPVPDTKVASGDVSYTFHGNLDYALGFISAFWICIYLFSLLFFFFPADLILTASLRLRTLTLDVHKVLGGVMEAKSLAEMTSAIPQITSQVLSVLMLMYVLSFCLLPGMVLSD
jgi:hypothetical protein